ncbi:MAG: DUF481 domain-containing protein [Planctomycetota bacterium]|nr:DUF481 domain-containing protein [Planctomycetota bacterium]MDA1214482.1 DUF481 domain-containing protein [Planctomycetota bacterium]
MIKQPSLISSLLTGICLFALSLFVSSDAVAQERLRLTDGTTLEGISLDVVDNSLKWIDADGKISSIPLDSVVRIEFLADGDSSANNPPAEPPPAPTVVPPTDDGTAPPTYVLADPAAVVDTGTNPTEGPPPTEATIDADGNLVPSEGKLSNDGYWDEFYDWTCETFETWTHRLELGARVLRGNSIEEYVNLGGKFQHETEQRSTQVDFSGQYGRNRGVIASNRWILNSNTDFNREGNWIVYVVTKNEYDEFENLDYRGTLSSGLGYKFINEPNKKLITRVGPGVTYEKFIHPGNHRTTPDLFSEIETLWPIGSSASYEHRTTAHPSIEDFGLIRIVSSHGVLFTLDERGRWKFKVDFRYEYNSRPNPGRLDSDYTTNFSLVYTRG